jgi:hypothetical protein
MNKHITFIALTTLACFALLPASTAQAAKIGKNSCGGTDVPKEMAPMFGQVGG